MEGAEKMFIVAVLDEYSYICLSYEVEVMRINTDNWRKLLHERKPAFFLVESVWNSYPILKGLSRQEKSIFNWCKKHQVPTVFWSKEDPVCFDIYIEYAKLFDYIFTTDSDSIAKYRNICPTSNVFLLPHAAQIKLHNPLNKEQEKINNVGFAGTWYENMWPERQRDLEILLGPSLKYGLDIYDRNSNLNLEGYQYPDKYRPFIKGNLPYKKMAEVYKKYNVFLNVNTVKDSPTMMSMRVFEVLACGINLISSYSRSMVNMFTDIIKISRNKSDTKCYLKELFNNRREREMLSLKGQREILMKHTYKHRLKKILTKLNLNSTEKSKGVSIICFINQKNYIRYAVDLENIINNFLRQNYSCKELLIFLPKINNSILKLVQSISQSHSHIKLIKIKRTGLSNKNISSVLAEVKYNYVSFFNEYCYYASEFLSDLMNSFKYNNAGVAGKLAHYQYLQARKQLILKESGEEYKYVNKLVAFSYIIKKECFKKLDSLYKSNIMNNEQFFNILLQNKVKIYAADKFNFINIIPDSNYYFNNKVVTQIDEKLINYVTV